MKSSIPKNLVVASAALLTCASLALPSHADTIAFSENSAPTSTPSGTGLVAFEFTLNANIDVTQLGFYAQSIGGGDTPQVSVFDVTGGITPSPLLLATTGNINSAITTQPGWNYVAATALNGSTLELTTGHTYLVSAPIYFSEQYASTAGFTTAPAISTSSYLVDPGWNGWSNSSYNFSSLSAPATGAYVSANFQYTLAPVTQVPEPSTYAMISAGLLTLLVVLRRRAAKLAL